MLRKSFLIIILPLLFLFSCSGNGSSKNTVSTSVINIKSSDVNASGSGGSFSYTINGERVETVNNVQHATLFINEVSNDAANGMLKIVVTCLSSSVFHFDIANSGTTTINGYHPSLSGFVDKKAKAATYMDGKTYRNHYAVSVTVTITSINGSRVEGTFSGTFKADENDGGATVNIKDGSFNLPFMKN
jgi:hypothetical protein